MLAATRGAAAAALAVGASRFSRQATLRSTSACARALVAACSNDAGVQPGQPQYHRESATGAQAGHGLRGFAFAGVGVVGVAVGVGVVGVAHCTPAGAAGGLGDSQSWNRSKATVTTLFEKFRCHSRLTAGLTLVHFSAQLEPCLTHKGTVHTLNTP
jgi:hypothetical protein